MFCQIGPDLKPGILFLRYTLIVALSGYQKTKTSWCRLSWVPSADTPTTLPCFDASLKKKKSCSAFIIMHEQSLLLTKTPVPALAKIVYGQCLEFNWAAGEVCIPYRGIKVKWLKE